ncbi:MAG: beta-galactosidase [Lachnospiraceae bacterium]|jgi:beta-galactosidase
MKKQKFQWPVKTMGVDYYPEQWDKALWESDLRRMRGAGISCIRIAEFAWNKVEPEEGHFTFEFFDEFLDLCAKQKMKVIFGTPTATPPAWLTEKYPEVLNAIKEGVLYRHGGRRHYNYNSPVYQKFAARIVEQEAAHYGKHPAVVGWQIDNELNCETADFYSESDDRAFRAFLRKKYGTLEELNRAWGTAFWNQTYTDWEQVHILRPVLNDGVNPHQHLDYLRFVSESCLRFAAMQANIIRRYKKPGDFITTNGMFGHLDNHILAGDILDVYTYDSYPNFAYQIGQKAGGADPESLKDRNWSLNLTQVRSICPHFGIMEQQAGPGGWTTRMGQPSPHPGQLTLWAMQSVAHGADYISFFRWRTATFGTEIYWHGILDYDSRDNRRLAEVRDFYKKLRTLDAAAGAEYCATFAMVTDYDNTFDAEADHLHGSVAEPSKRGIFKAAQLTHTPFDMVNVTDQTDISELAAYPVLLYPHPVIMDEVRAALLETYVRGGGTLVLGCRSGYKDMNGHCVMMPQPGLLSRLTGTTVKDFSFACPGEEPVRACMADGEHIPMPVWNDILEPEPDTKVIGRYENGYFQNEAAVTEHALGAGRVIHVGSCFSSETAEYVLKYLGLTEPFADVIKAPAEVEIALQKKDGRHFLFVLNFAHEEKQISLQRPVRFLYTGETVQGEVTLSACGTAVYEYGSTS